MVGDQIICYMISLFGTCVASWHTSSHVYSLRDLPFTSLSNTFILFSIIDTVPPRLFCDISHTCPLPAYTRHQVISPRDHREIHVQTEILVIEPHLQFFPHNTTALFIL